jgi:hypothetical protein
MAYAADNDLCALVVPSRRATTIDDNPRNEVRGILMAVVLSVALFSMPLLVGIGTL